jgi:hypothetical protein
MANKNLANLLSIVEQARYASMKHTMKTSEENWLTAIMVIRNERLYRQEYATFDAFTKAELPYTKRRADQLIEFKETVQRLGTIVPKPPANESQTRELGKLKPEDQARAWKIALDSAKGEQPTAKQVKAVVMEIKVPVPPKKPRDDSEIEWKATQYAKPVELYCQRLMKQVKDLVRMHEVSDRDAEGLRDRLRGWFQMFRQLAGLPRRKAPPPRPGTCKYCQAPLLWVQTENGKRMPVDAEPGGGQFDLIGGVAVCVDRATAKGQPLYRSHFMSCTKMPRK